MSEREKIVLEELLLREDLAEKKARIYARLLTDTGLVKKIEGVAEHHAARKATLQEFLGKRVKKEGEKSDA